jgi:cysteinyl-tRNA synthetase
LKDATPEAKTLLGRLDEAVAADLSTPVILVLLQEVVRNESLNHREKSILVSSCEALLGLGLDNAATGTLDPTGRETRRTAGEHRDIQRLLAGREEARCRRDWAEADRLRDELRGLGIQVVDTPEGQSWTEL